MSYRLCACGNRMDRESQTCAACRFAQRKRDAERFCVDCQRKIPHESTRCRPCWEASRKIRRDNFAASRSRGLSKMRGAERRAAGPREDMVNVQTRENRRAGNPYGLGHAKCGRCRKPTIYSGLCYECARPGRQRTLFRPEEREAMATRLAAA